MRSEWLYRDPFGRKVRWCIGWLFYPLTIFLDLYDDPDTGSLPLDICAMVFGAFLLASTICTPAVHLSGLNWIIPWWIAPMGTGVLYLFFGLIHHWNHEELFGRSPY